LLVACAWDESIVTVGSTRLRVASMGSGPPLLLMMGIGGNLDMWTPFASMVDGRRLIAFDAPGTGRSEMGRPRRMRGLADLTAQLLDVLGLDAVDVLGASFGGALAQEFGHRHPDRVRRLVLAATACGLIGVPPRPGVFLHLAHPLRYYSESYVRWAGPGLYGGRTQRPPAAAADP
jgi:pimeloyl-ACP methyl ester carboxylesterase